MLLLLGKAVLLFFIVTNNFLRILLHHAGWNAAFGAWVCALVALGAVVGLIREWRVQADVSWARIGVDSWPSAGAWALGAGAGILALGAHILISQWIPVDHARNLANTLAEISAPFWKTQTAMLLLIYAALEELFFRGFFLACLRKRFGDVRAVLGAAALFALFHASLTDAPRHFAMGVIYGAVAIGTGSIYPLILGHWMHNAFAVFG